VTHIKSSKDLLKFLAWQADWRKDIKEQCSFQENVLNYPRLLVFMVMRKKSPYIHLIQSAGVYPKVPGADQDWKGTGIGFLGDKIQYGCLLMVELGKTTPWPWEDSTITDEVATATFYTIPEN
jgi:hypothetical protein